MALRLLAIALLPLCLLAQNAPAYDGNYHGVWYPIGTNTTPFVTAQGRLFKVNGKTQYLTGNLLLPNSLLSLTHQLRCQCLVGTATP